jgi:putative flavoprotein involved in K+ transport
MQFHGDPGGFPTKDEMADYLEEYARHFELPVKLGTEVTRLEHSGDLFHASTNDGTTLTSSAVVLAAGAFQEPAIPALARQVDTNIVQLTPESYGNPQQTPTGTVLVVGDGATGRQIALELSATHHVFLSTGRPRRVSPDRLLGRSIFWWMDKLGILRAPASSAVGRRLKQADPFPGKHLGLTKLSKRGIAVVGRLSEVAGRNVSFADGQSVQIDVVIWATGYRDRTEWVAVPGATDARGEFVEQQGISPVKGLAFIGRSWQLSRGSALVTGVGTDARTIVERLSKAREDLTETSREAEPIRFEAA